MLAIKNTTIGKINEALKTVQSSSPILRSTSSISREKFYLQNMKNNLVKFLTADEYPNATLTWPKIPDVTGMATETFMKVRAAKEKKENYQNVWKNHLENRTTLENDEKNLNPIFNSGRRKRSTNPAIDEVLNASNSVKNQFTTCMNLLNDSISKVDLMIQNLLEPTTTPTTTPITNPFCASTKDAKDSNGQYIKTMCKARFAVNYASALTTCQAQLMNLYAITSQDEMTALYTYIAEDSQINEGFFINGKFDGTNWIINNPDTKILFTGAIPTALTGDCLMVVKWSAGATTARDQCNTQRWIICEGNFSSNYNL